MNIILNIWDHIIHLIKSNQEEELSRTLIQQKQKKRKKKEEEVENSLIALGSIMCVWHSHLLPGLYDMNALGFGIFFFFWVTLEERNPLAPFSSRNGF